MDFIRAAQKLTPGRLRLESKTEPGSAMLKVLQLALAQLLVVRFWRLRVVGLAMLEHGEDNPGQLFTQRIQPVFSDLAKGIDPDV